MIAFKKPEQIGVAFFFCMSHLFSLLGLVINLSFALKKNRKKAKETEIMRPKQKLIPCCPLWLLKLDFSFPGGQNKKGNVISYKILFAHKIKVLELLKRKVFLAS